MLGEYYTIQQTVVTYHSTSKFCKVSSRVLNAQRSSVFNFQYIFQYLTFEALFFHA